MAGVKAWLDGWLAVRRAARLAVPYSLEASGRTADRTGIENLCIPIHHNLRYEATSHMTDQLTARCGRRRMIVVSLDGTGFVL